MSNKYNYPADKKGTSSQYYDGKPILNDTIKEGAPLNLVLKTYAEVLEAIDDFISLSDLSAAYYNLDSVSGEVKNKLTILLNKIGSDIHGINEVLAGVSESLNEENPLSEALYKIKLDLEDTAAGFLNDKLTSEQKGGLKTVSSKLSVVGLVPPGAIFLIGSEYIGDFDNSGKGKEGSGFWGYAVCNGANGTKNYMKDLYVRFPDVMSKASQEAGNTEFTVKGKNLEDMELNVSGGITGFVGNGTGTVPMSQRTINAAVSGGTQIVVYSPSGTSSPVANNVNINHGHTHTLKASWANQIAEAIKLDPKGVYLIPITKINV